MIPIGLSHRSTHITCGAKPPGTCSLWIRAPLGAQFPAAKIELRKHAGPETLSKKKESVTVTFTPPPGPREGCVEHIRAANSVSFPKGDIWWSYWVTSPPHLLVIDSCLLFPPPFPEFISPVWAEEMN